MQHVTDEYGTAESDAVVPIMVGEKRYTHRVWIHKTKSKIMAQTDSMAGATTAGFVRGLTLGAVKGDIEYEPIQRAAAEYLSSTRGPGCALSNSRKLTHVGWEWDFHCARRCANIAGLELVHEGIAGL
jgi:hypothetical protein